MDSENLASNYRLQRGRGCDMAAQSRQLPGAGHVLTINNGKGGVAKTTTAFHLAHGLAQLGLKLCVIDFDPQGGFTKAVGIPDDQIAHTSADAIVGGADPRDIIIDSYILNKGSKDERLVQLPFDLICSTPDVAAVELQWMQSLLKIEELLLNGKLEEARVATVHARTEWRVGLRRLCNALRDDYDLILIDNQPTLGAMSIMSMEAADHLLIPVSAENMSIPGIANLSRILNEHIFHHNSTLRVLGVLITMVDRRPNSPSQAAIREIIARARALNWPVFDAYIPLTHKVAEAMAQNDSIWSLEVSRGSTAAVDAAQAYAAVAKQIANHYHALAARQRRSIV